MFHEPSGSLDLPAVLTRKSKYGLKALLRMARAPDRSMLASEIAEAEGIPKKFLQLILLELPVPEGGVWAPPPMVRLENPDGDVEIQVEERLLRPESGYLLEGELIFNVEGWGRFRLRLGDGPTSPAH